MLHDGMRILDVGCVDGWVLDEHPGALGVDSRPAPAKWGDRVRECDAERITCDDGYFDAVTCVSVLEHVGLGWYGDPAGDEGKAGRVVAEMARVLAPGGWLFLTVPIGLMMTKDGKPFAREIDTYDLRVWVEGAGLVIHEWIEAESTTWTAAPDDRSHFPRWLALISAQKTVTA